MTRLKQLREDLKAMVDEGSQLAQMVRKDDRDIVEFSMRYQSWYTKALDIVTVFLPARVAEFRDYYRPERRRDISVESYGIADLLLGLSISKFSAPAFDSGAVAQSKLLQQVVMVLSVSDKLDSSLANIRGVLQADLFDSELAAAVELRKNGHLRAAGVIAGVVLERHLRTVCTTHELTIRKKNPSLADLNDLLKNNEVLDLPTWRHIQRLADIRNLAAHAKEREPTEDEVDDLVSGAAKLTKSLF